MPIAPTVERFLIQKRVPYDLMAHPHTRTSRETARASHVRMERIAKAVLVEDEQGSVMVIIPADHHLDMDKLRSYLGRDVTLCSETRFVDLFRDCEQGAIPPLGPAYGIDTMLDQAVLEKPDVYFEAGDHQELIHLSADQFLTLLGPTVKRGRFSRPPI